MLIGNELMTIIIDSMKNHRPAKAEQTDVLRPYTMAEIDAMLDEAFWDTRREPKRQASQIK